MTDRWRIGFVMISSSVPFHVAKGAFWAKNATKNKKIGVLVT